jgi:hypothetical protein
VVAGQQEQGLYTGVAIPPTVAMEARAEVESTPVPLQVQAEVGAGAAALPSFTRPDPRPPGRMHGTAGPPPSPRPRRALSRFTPAPPAASHLPEKVPGAGAAMPFASANSAGGGVGPVPETPSQASHQSAAPGPKGRKPGPRPCPYCLSPQVTRSRRRNVWERVLILMLLRPYRCLECDARFYGRVSFR